MKILIVGAGVDAWMTAAVLATAAKGVAEIAVNETAPPAHGQLVALPALHGLHERLGIQVGTPLLGLRHGEALEPFGDTGAMLEGLAFHHYWLRAGDGAPLNAWSLSAQAAARGRFATRSADPRSPLSTLDHGLLLDAAEYAATLKAVALKAGAVLTDKRPDADLLIDASGDECLLMAHETWIDWSHWLPKGVEAIGDPGLVATFRDVPVKAGRLAHAVSGNAVAIGRAYATIGAGDGGDLHLLQTTVSRLVALLPTGPAAIDEFNRLTALAVDRARDMAILRWGVLDAPPEELAWKIAQFESRGRVVLYDEETWPEQSWVHALLARGIVPQRWDPLVERVPLGQMREMLGRMKAVIERTAEEMPRA
jgi:tryptophan halogenase